MQEENGKEGKRNTNLRIRFKVKFHIAIIVEPQIVDNNLCAMSPNVIKLPLITRKKSYERTLKLENCKKKLLLSITFCKEWKKLASEQLH